MTRKTTGAYRHECVTRSLEAAAASPETLKRKYPYMTAQGWARISDNGNLYKRIGRRILSFPQEVIEKIRLIEPYLTLNRLRRIATKTKSKQECITLVHVWYVEIKKKGLVQ